MAVLITPAWEADIVAEAFLFVAAVVTVKLFDVVPALACALVQEYQAHDVSRQHCGVARLAHRQERMVEDMVGHAAALGDAFALVEEPVDAEIDPALAVLFLGLRQ